MVCYFKPETPIDTILLNLRPFLESTIDKPLLLAGDFNCRLDKGVRGTQLSDDLLTLGLTCANTPHLYTYHCPKGQSTIDLIFVKNIILTGDICVDNIVSTKHSLVHAQLQLDKSIQSKKSSKRITKVNEKVLQSLLNTHLYCHPPERLNAPEIYDILYNCINSANSRRKPRKSKVWFNRDCYISYRMLKFALKCGDGIAIAKSRYKRACRLAKIQYEKSRIENIIHTAENNRSKFWSLMKTKRQTAAPGEVNQSKWLEHFSSILLNTEPVTFDPLLCHTEYIDTLDHPISLTEITQSLSELRSGSAPGPDGITVGCLKHVFPIIYPALEEIYMKILQDKMVPTTWLTATLSSLYKGTGSPNDPDNYRGLATSNALYKVLTTTLKKRLLAFVNERNLLPCEQHGFVSGKSTTTAIRSLLQTIRSNTEKQLPTFACFVDFKKAFDSIDRSILLRKLQQLGISASFAKTLYSIISENYLSMKIGDYISDSITQNIGVAQGDPLSPLLFVLYIADLSTMLKNCNTKSIFYADDLVITATNQSDLQLALDRLGNYCKVNKLEVNVQKTKLMNFTRKRSLSKYKTTYMGIELEYVKEFKYLGVVLTPTLNPKAHLNHLHRKGILSTNILCSKTHLQKLSFQAAQTLLDAVIIPSATYGLYALNTDGSSILQKVIAYYWKRWIGLSKFARNTPILYHIYNEDHLEIRKRIGFNRRVIGMYYSNGLHHKICLNDRCYETKTMCSCKYCGNTIHDQYHILEDCIFCDNDFLHTLKSILNSS